MSSDAEKTIIRLNNIRIRRAIADVDSTQMASDIAFLLRYAQALEKLIYEVDGFAGENLQEVHAQIWRSTYV